MEENRFRKIIIIALAALVLFPPFISGVNSSQPSGAEFDWLASTLSTFQWAGTFFQVGIFFLLLLWVTGENKKGAVTFRKTPLTLPLLLFFILFLLSTIPSINFYESKKLLFQALGYLGLFYLTINCLKEKRESYFLVATVLVGAFIISLYGIFQYLFIFEKVGEELVREKEYFFHFQELLGRLEGRRVFATFFYPPAFAGYLILIIPLSLSLFLKAPGKISLLLFLPLVSFLFTLLLASSRAAYPALIAAGLLCLMLLKNERIPRARWLSLAAALLLTGILAVFVFGKKQPPQPIAAASALGLRLGYWQGALRMIKARPFLGFGPGTFGIAYPHYQVSGAGLARLAHNGFLQIFAESGIFAFLALLWFGITFFVKGIKGLAKGGELRVVSVGIFSGLVAFLLHSLVDVDFYVPGIMVTASLLLGVFVKSRVSGEGVFRISGRKWTSMLALILVIIFQTMVIRPALSQNSGALALEFLTIGHYPRAEKELRAAIRYAPGCADNHYYLASRILAPKLLRETRGENEDFKRIKEEAIREYRRAISLDPYRSIYYYELGKLYYLSEGEEGMKRAIEELRRAVFYYPGNLRYRYELAELYRAKRDAGDARSEKKNGESMEVR